MTKDPLKEAAAAAAKVNPGIFEYGIGGWEYWEAVAKAVLDSVEETSKEQNDVRSQNSATLD